jgi:hypothetical protein
MDHTFEFPIDVPIAIVRTLGDAELEGWRRYHDDLLADPRFVPGMPLLVDHTDLDATGMTAGDARAIGDLVASYQAALRNSPRAVVVPDRFRYGMGRVAQHRADPDLHYSAVFYERAEAEAWLRGRLAPSD